MSDARNANHATASAVFANGGTVAVDHGDVAPIEVWEGPTWGYTLDDALDRVDADYGRATRDLFTVYTWDLEDLN